MKSSVVYACQQCGYESGKWYGKCPECGQWNSLIETVKQVKNSKYSVHYTAQESVPQKLSTVKHIERDRLKSEFEEFDRVTGGGIVPGSVTLLAGDPGIGKSTLLLHILSKVGGVYVSGEESAEQIKLRAKRLGISGENIIVLATTDVGSIIQSMEKIHTSSAPSISKQDTVSLFIIDSIQTIGSPELPGLPGSVSQIKLCSEQLIKMAKSKNIPMFIIGHVTKEGTIAGPKILEHMVDTVLYLEGERFASARILRTLKNRYGAIEEVGLFEMKDTGLAEIDNPSKLFLQDRVEHVPGSVITVIMEGSRPLLVEIQALTVPSQLAIPRRVANGCDYNRLQLLIAILQRRLNIPLGSHDVFVNVSGGLNIEEPGADLAICLAVVSSFQNKAVDPRMAAFGEVGLLGEIRSIGSSERRIKESKRLGFTKIISSPQYKSLKDIASIFHP
jgi:DNA repair protein RadA/Sms